MWIDITMPLHSLMAVWPGDTAFHYKLDATLADDGANVGRIQMSLHAGTHVDAPYHYDQFGKAVESLPIDLFIGQVEIVDATAVQVIDEAFVNGLQLKDVHRVFFKTKNVYNFLTFPEQYCTFTAGAIRALNEKGVALIGTDAPSIDALQDTSLAAHHACRGCGMLIVENLYMKDVEAGAYEFIGLPLPIQGGDASPIRAVIRKVV